MRAMEPELTSDKRQDFFTDILKIFGSNLISKLLSVPVSFLLPYLFGPTVFGTYKLIMLIISYARFDNLGAHISLNREIPKLLKKGDYLNMY